ncbi:MAG: AAA family ATPase [bacterium]
MKIKKLKKIDNVFSYIHFNWETINPSTYIENGVNKSRDTSFQKDNVIFAENGSGKSKLVSLFKKINNGESNIEKHRDHEVSPQKVIIELDGNNPNLEFETSWSQPNALLSKFIIFDKHFIDQSVHSLGTSDNDTTQRKQQRAKDIIYLGNFAEYNNEIERANSLKSVVDDKNKDFISKEKLKIETIFKGVFTSDELLSKREYIEEIDINTIEDIKSRITSSEQELVKVNLALKDKSKITTLKDLSTVEYSFSFENISKEGKKVIYDPDELFNFTVSKGVQSTLNKISHKKEFIRQGLQFIEDKGDFCPFCEQGIKAGDPMSLVSDYQKIFDKVFLDEESKVRESLRAYKNLIIKIRDYKVKNDNTKDFEEASRFIHLEKILPLVKIDNHYLDVLNNELELIEQKNSNILEKVEGSNLSVVKEIIVNISKQLSEYNIVVLDTNIKINKIKNDTNDGKIEQRKKELDEIIKTLLEDKILIENKISILEYFSAVDIYNSNMNTIQSFDKICTAMKEKIVEEFNLFVDEYFELIKSFVKQISPTMDIFDIDGQATYDRRSTRDPAMCGFRIKYNGQDCTDYLSEGERQVVALAFFFAFLTKQTDKDKIVILDDPITSFDAGKRKSTSELIKTVTKDYSQLFVFTCDPLFRQYCLKQFTNRNLYYVLKTAGSSALHYVPTKRETIYSSFEEDFKNINSVLGTCENVVVYGQKLRFCLETKIREEIFGYSKDNLSEMIDVATQNNGIRINNLISKKDIVLNIYSYCNTGGLAHYPRDGSSSWNELVAKISEYLSLQI